MPMRKDAVAAGLVEIRGIYCRPQDKPIIRKWIPTPNVCDRYRKVIEQDSIDAKLKESQNAPCADALILEACKAGGSDEVGRATKASGVIPRGFLALVQQQP
jgi:hypothetical protein